MKEEKICYKMVYYTLCFVDNLVCSNSLQMFQSLRRENVAKCSYLNSIRTQKEEVGSKGAESRTEST